MTTIFPGSLQTRLESPQDFLSENSPRCSSRAVSITPLDSITRKNHSASPSSRPNHPWPVPKSLHPCYWTSSIQDMPSYDCSPWDYYEPFLLLDSGHKLVLCNNRTEIRLMRSGFPKSGSFWSRLSQIQHKNFINIYEVYFFEGCLFVVSEFTEFSLQDMIRYSIHPLEREIAYIIHQVLDGMRFVASNDIGNQVVISGRNIRISSKGDVKIDPSTPPEDDEQTSTDLTSLGSLMLTIMSETKDTIKSATLHHWSAEAIHFVEATLSATLDELSDHVFLKCPSDPKTLVPLYTVCSLLIRRRAQRLGAFEKINV